MLPDLTILLDWVRPKHSQSDAGSVLLMPAGLHTYAEHLRGLLGAGGPGGTIVVPNFEATEEYVARLQQVLPGVRIARPQQLSALWQEKESSDTVLFVDARYCPREPSALQNLLSAAPDRRLARYLLHLDAVEDGLREEVVSDAARRVLAIRRLYKGVTQLETQAVSLAVMSVAAARHICPSTTLSLAEIRSQVSAAGLPGCDVLAIQPALDLLSDIDLIQLNDDCLATLIGATNGHTVLAPGVVLERGCRVHPSARLYGPVALQKNVVVDADAVIIGPAAVGADAHIGGRAVVCESVLGAHAQVPAGSQCVRQVLVAGNSDGHAPSARALLHPLAVRELRARGRGPSDGGASGRLYRWTARARDFVCVLAGLVALAPVFLVVAVLIRMTSRGPVFFAHEREGRGGRRFRCWKFRTMSRDAHAHQRGLYGQSVVDGPQFKLRDDPRTTRLGVILRRTNIDELPQLFNVLLGHMSLVGPRPSPFRENQICVPWRQARLSVRPGITGLWQLCRQDRDCGDFHQWIYFDELYVRHCSTWLDLRILLATALTLGGRWSVPLTWMIPAARLASSASAATFWSGNGHAPPLDRSRGCERHEPVTQPLVPLVEGMTKRKSRARSHRDSAGPEPIIASHP
jgi:lipopolysaccharide/colanic/teichoic acid biosynthesis glycosyltransferase